MHPRKIFEIFDRVPRSLKRHRITLSNILKIFNKSWRDGNDITLRCNPWEKIVVYLLKTMNWRVLNHNRTCLEKEHTLKKCSKRRLAPLKRLNKRYYSKKSREIDLHFIINAWDYQYLTRYNRILKYRLNICIPL